MARQSRVKMRVTFPRRLVSLSQHFKVLCNKPPRANANQNDTLNVSLHSYKTRFGVVFANRLHDREGRLV